MGWGILFMVLVMMVGFVTHQPWLSLTAALLALGLSLRVVGQTAWPLLRQVLTPKQWRFSIAILGALAATIGLYQLSYLRQWVEAWLQQVDWERFGTLGSLLGALGQIMVAILALYVGWEQYVIGKDLTIRANMITQQQTIDAYFEGIAQLMLNDDGLLEDFPMERAIAEGRTAALLTSIDAGGKAKVLRFLSRSGLLTPIKRDQRLGLPILDGNGVYAEDRDNGLRVIDLGVVLSEADLSHTDLRWTDLSTIDLSYTNLSGCELVGANLAQTNLQGAVLTKADLFGTRLFYGPAQTATPADRSQRPDFTTGGGTGAIVAEADFSKVQRLSEEQRYYCCSWGGDRARQTIPGGCQGIVSRVAG